MYTGRKLSFPVAKLTLLYSILISTFFKTMPTSPKMIVQIMIMMMSMKTMNFFSEMTDRQKFVKFHFQTRLLLWVLTSQQTPYMPLAEL